MSGNRTNMIVWSTHSTKHSTYHQVQLQQPQPPIETDSQADDITLYYAMPSVCGDFHPSIHTERIFSNFQNPDLKSRIADHDDCRNQFIYQGSLSGASLPPPSTINKCVRFKRIVCPVDAL